MNDENEVIPLDKLARVYRKIYTKVQDLTKEYESQVEELKAKQDEIKNAMKDQMMALGTSSVRTDEGTIILSQKTRYYTNDWDSFKQFVIEHDALDLFEKRIAQKNMSMFLEENPGSVPAGLNSMSEYAVTVRKPTN
jgi:flagellar biosynthesis GTPase FlhF|tara:strand:+ start:101 stop:511 length:411 start_codon:yes stop_codon:yes gene_type:complete